MSRIGKIPIDIPPEVSINIDENKVIVKGKQGELSLNVDRCIKLNLENGKLILAPVSGSKEHRSKHGLYRSLLNNMVIGVSKGFSKTLEVVGVGYRVNKKGKAIELLMGYSNPVIIEEADGVTFEVPDRNTIIVRGIDKQKVGEAASKIRSVRKPEPYKGKGIKYKDEIIKKKVGKAAVTAEK